MIGKASQLRSKLVVGRFVPDPESEKKQFKFENVDVVLNETFERLGDVEVISVQYQVTPDGSGDDWPSALLIYKENN